MCYWYLGPIIHHLTGACLPRRSQHSGSQLRVAPRKKGEKAGHTASYHGGENRYMVCRASSSAAEAGSRLDGASAKWIAVATTGTDVAKYYT